MLSHAPLNAQMLTNVWLTVLPLLTNQARAWKLYFSGWPAGWPDGRLDSDNNATQPAGAGAWLSLAITFIVPI